MEQTQSKAGLDANLVNAIVKSTSDVLMTMANTPVAFKEVQAEANYRSTGDISAIIGILGDEGEGVFTVSFSTKLASLIIARLLGTQPQMLSTDDRTDGVGELMNMISGNAKAILCQNSGSLYRLSLPTVILGSNHEVIQGPKDTPYLVLGFECEGERFHVKVCFKPSKSPN